MEEIQRDNSKVIEYINYTFSEKNIEEDEYALENFETNLKLDVLKSKDDIIKAVKLLKNHKDVNINTSKIIRFINDCNINKLKLASNILNKLIQLTESCECNSSHTFTTLSPYLKPFKFNGIVDLITGYDLYNSDGCDEDIIAVIYEKNSLYLKHIYIEDNAYISVYKSYEINEKELDNTIKEFKDYFEAYNKEYA